MHNKFSMTLWCCSVYILSMASIVVGCDILQEGICYNIDTYCGYTNTDLMVVGQNYKKKKLFLELHSNRVLKKDAIPNKSIFNTLCYPKLYTIDKTLSSSGLLLLTARSPEGEKYNPHLHINVMHVLSLLYIHNKYARGLVIASLWNDRLAKTQDYLYWVTVEVDEHNKELNLRPEQYWLLSSDKNITNVVLTPTDFAVIFYDNATPECMRLKRQPYQDLWNCKKFYDCTLHYR